MGLEAATYIHQLNSGWPVGASDPKSQGDEHIRLLKMTIQATFPNIAGEMNVSHTLLNQWGGLAGAYTWTGQHNWTLQLRSADGSAALPAYSFSGDTNTGLYLVGADQLGLSTGGAVRVAVSTTSLTANIPFRLADGSAAAPSFAFDNDADTGFYRVTNDVIGLATGGALRFNFGSFGVRGPDGTAAIPAYSFDSDSNTGIYKAAADTVGIAAGGNEIAQFYNTGIYLAAGKVFLPQNDGSAAAPAYSFYADQDIGMYRYAANQLGFSTGGAYRGSFGNTFFDTAVVHYGPDGIASGPTYSFSNDTNTGVYLAGADQLAFAEGGTGYRIGFRNVPRSTTVTTLAIGDVGKCVAITAAINIPASVFSAGDCISIYNDSAGALNITISAGTLRLAGTTTTGTRSIQPRGMATLWFNVGGATPEVICSGNVS